MNAKYWLHSKTLWFNIFVAVLAVIDSQADVLKSVLPDGGYLAITLFASVGNTILRTMTNAALTVKK